nr:reverse transcriptase domain-containing protein [Tanacetum cinerariifolium]
MSTRSSARNLVPPLEDPERTIQRRNRSDPALLFNFEEINMVNNNEKNHEQRPPEGDTFYNELTLRHRDTINAVAGGTFMKRRPEECYDLIDNMTTHHNDWETTVQRGASCSSLTSSNVEITALKNEMSEMNKNFFKMFQNQQVNSVTPSCETYDSPHSYRKCQATNGHIQNVYAAGTYNQGGNTYQPQGKFHFLTDFVFIDYVVDPWVPLILGRPFLRTGRTLIDVYGEELTLQVDNEAITFKVGQTLKYSYNDAELINQIDIIEVACKEYAQQVLGFSEISTSGNPTSEPIISASSPTLTPFEDSDFLLEEIDAFLAIEDDSIS